MSETEELSEQYKSMGGSPNDFDSPSALRQKIGVLNNIRAYRESGHNRPSEWINDTGPNGAYVNREADNE